MNVTVKTTNIWGKETIYPLSQDACMICQLAKTKTFTEHMLRTLQKHGVIIHIAKQSGVIVPIVEG